MPCAVPPFDAGHLTLFSPIILSDQRVAVNESSPAAPSVLSVVLVAGGGLSSIARTMKHLRSQSARGAMEVIVVAPATDAAAVDALGGGGFAAFRIVVAGPITARGEAAALGILAATSPIVGLIEDHSFPEPEWAASLIRAHAGTWTGVGPAVENANPNSVMSWVNFILAYGAFAGDVAPGQRELLPWHNSAYKADVLAPFAARLGELLEWEGMLQDELRARGHTLYLEPAARTHHMNVSRLASTLGLNRQRGRVLGALRAKREGWPLWRRLLQACAFPLFPALQLRHLTPCINRLVIPSSLKPRVVLGLLPALVMMAVGEAWGLAFGLGDAITRMEDYELHRARHLCRSERFEMERTEPLHARPNVGLASTSH